MVGRPIFLLLIFVIAYDWSVDHLSLNEEDVLVSTVLLFFVLCVAGFKMGSLPSSSSASDPAKNVLSIIDEQKMSGP